MKNYKTLILLLSLFSLLNAKMDINKDFLLGVTVDSFNKVHQNKIKSSVIKLEDEFRKIFDEEMDLKIEFEENQNKLLQNFIKYEKHNAAVYYSSFYLEHKELIKEYAKDFFAFSNKDLFYSYILVTRKDANINTLTDLKNKRYAKYTANETFSHWLDYLTLKELGKSYTQLIGKSIEIKKNSRLLLNLYFNKADFTVVKKSVYEDMVALNPALKKKLKVFKESEKVFMYGIGFFHKKTPQKIVDLFYKYTTDEEFAKKLEYVYRLLEQSSIQRVNDEQLKVLESFYDEYEKLKRK